MFHPLGRCFHSYMKMRLPLQNPRCNENMRCFFGFWTPSQNTLTHLSSPADERSAVCTATLLQCKLSAGVHNKTRSTRMQTCCCRAQVKSDSPPPQPLPHRAGAPSQPRSHFITLRLSSFLTCSDTSSLQKQC